MKVKPVKNYKLPSYPDRRKARSSPEMFSNMPKRWKNSVLLTAIISSTLMVSTTSCQKAMLSSANSKSCKVSPIFVHGEGIYHSNPQVSLEGIPWQSIESEDNTRSIIDKSGSGLRSQEGTVMLLGGVSKRPKTILVGNGPIFNSDTENDFLQHINPKVEIELLESIKPISETEAFKIINDEASKAGIQFETYIDEGNNLLEINRVDAYNANSNIGFEFVSVSDMDEIVDSSKNSDNDFSNKDIVEEITDQKVYKLLDTAQQLREDKEKKGAQLNMGFFYDPGAGYYEDNKFISQEEALREQVRDFIEWLKNEGIY